MNFNPLVSVVIPVYNGEEFLGECLSSVAGQTYQNIEAVIVDDGSIDGSYSIAEGWNFRKKIIRQKNGDVSSARNAGVRQAEGELVAFLDQDDYWDADKVRRQVEYFAAEPGISLCFTEIAKILRDGRLHVAKDKQKIARSLGDENLFYKLINKNVLMPSAVMVKKEDFERAGLFNETFKTCGDYEMWLRMAALGMKFRYLPDPLTYYRMHGGNASYKTETMNSDRIKAMEAAFSYDFLPAEFARYRKLGMARVYAEAANGSFSSKNYEKFFEYFRLAARSDIRSITVKLLRRRLTAKIRSRRAV
ncbi:MAG: glycosyltransferase [Chloroflexota bacterium]